MERQVSRQRQIREMWLRSAGPVERLWLRSSGAATLVLTFYEIATWH